MPFSISAEFLLGTYQGRNSGGNPERYPSPDRLYKALVSTAYNVFGFERPDRSDDDGPTDSDIRDAFLWLEGNPPDAIYLPPARFSVLPSVADAVVYRDKGYIDSTKNKRRPKKASALASTNVTYQDTDGRLTWQWQREPEPSIIDTLATLCWEVPYLGESCSKVRLTAAVTQEYPMPGSLEKDDAVGFANLGRRGNIVFAFPGTGRLEELQHGYEQISPLRNRKKDTASGKEKEEEKNLLAAFPMLDTVKEASYSAPAAASRGLRKPWPDFIVIPVTPDVAENASSVWCPSPADYVGWAVAMHRFLVSQWGLNPPAALTGKYSADSGMGRPSNNVAIHILSASMGKAADSLDEKIKSYGFPGFLLMLPESMHTEDRQRLYDVCRASQGKFVYYSRSVGRIRLGAPHYESNGSLWHEPATDRIRFWQPFPLAIAETRPMSPDTQTGRIWQATEAMYLALRHVWRNASFMERQAGENERPVSKNRQQAYEERIWTLTKRASDADSPLRVYGARQVFEINMGDYAHHVDASNVLRGMSGLISIDAEETDVACAALAVGQSRHLGGGLLLPIDVPLDLVQEDREGRNVPVWVR